MPKIYSNETMMILHPYMFSMQVQMQILHKEQNVTLQDPKNYSLLIRILIL